MNVLLSPTEDDVMDALQAFLQGVLPDGIQVFQAQANRVPEPSANNFVEMTPILRTRLSTNIDDYLDCLFTGSIAGAVLTVTDVAFGALVQGHPVFGSGVTSGTTIGVQASGAPGGIGVYAVTPSQTVTSRTLASGVAELLQPVMMTVQLDVHGDAGADNVQIITTAFYDGYGVQQFTELNSLVSPLYCGDPNQMPFINENSQFEQRWTVDLKLQVQQTITVPQQFAGAVTVDVISVEATYPL